MGRLGKLFPRAIATAETLCARLEFPMVTNPWPLIKQTVMAFIEDEALSRGAAIAFYAVTSLGPVLLIVIAIAGLVFGQDAAMGAIVGQFRDLMGQQSAELLQTVVKSAAAQRSGTLATVLGVVMLLVTASGVFSEMQSALNAFWKVEPTGTTVSRLVRARAASLGLVAAMGFLLLASLVISAGLAAVSGYINARLPFASLALELINFVISLALISALFATIYKVLPDKQLQWRDVWVGAVATAILFNLGKLLVGLYIGSSAIGSSYGAAGALIIVLLWIYYSAEIFLLGAEFTKVCANRRRTEQVHPRSSQDRVSDASAKQVGGASRPRVIPMWHMLAAVFLIRALLPFDRRRRKASAP